MIPMTQAWATDVGGALEHVAGGLLSHARRWASRRAGPAALAWATAAASGEPPAAFGDEASVRAKPACDGGCTLARRRRGRLRLAAAARATEPVARRRRATVAHDGLLARLFAVRLALGFGERRRGADSERRCCSVGSGSSRRTLKSESGAPPLFSWTAITDVSSPFGKLGGRLRARSKIGNAASSSSSSSSSLTSNSRLARSALFFALTMRICSSCPLDGADVPCAVRRLVAVGAEHLHLQPHPGLVAGDRLQVRRHLRRADDEAMARADARQPLLELLGVLEAAGRIERQRLEDHHVEIGWDLGPLQRRRLDRLGVDL